MKNMKQLTAEFQITTPMFIGESDQQCADMVRPPSIKGALRFWWRALRWAEIAANQSNQDLALQTLHREEGELFGASAQDDKNKHSGQGQFMLRVTQQVAKPEKPEQLQRMPSVQYLLGMGLYHFRNGLLRDCISSGTFKVELLCKPNISDNQYQQLEKALICLGLLGGLGSRSRKGLGSVSLQEISGGSLKAPQDTEQFKKLLNQLFQSSQSLKQQPPIAAFSALSRIQTSNPSSDALKLLAKYGEEMAMYRGWGREGKVFGNKAEQNFKHDHDWAYKIAKGGTSSELPKRSVFGLPHAYNVSEEALKRKAPTVDVSDGRRASPLFAHIHQFSNGQCMLVNTIIQSDFLGQGMKVKITKGRDEFSDKQVNEQMDWSVLHDFLDRFESKEIILSGTVGNS